MFVCKESRERCNLRISLEETSTKAKSCSLDEPFRRFSARLIVGMDDGDVWLRAGGKSGLRLEERDGEEESEEEDVLVVQLSALHRLAAQ